MVHKFLSDSELDALNAGAPRLDDLGRHALVPFEVRRLNDCSVIWLNDRWFGERGFDTSDAKTKERLKAWLLNDFAFVAPDGAQAGLKGEARTWHCDRYGSTEGMSPHGGSGRVATVGCFQVKGVGITPLVGGGSAGHAHGRSSVAEALREAIYAEVADAEFPFGAVPTIAVLDTGVCFSSPDQNERFDQNTRRGLSIRPAVFRAAHIERAPLFKVSAKGFKNSQLDDAARARDAVARWTNFAVNNKDRNGTHPLTEFVDVLSEQIAFGRVHRLFNGGIFSSNISVDGRLLDFGNMHALPDWSAAKVLSHAVAFGSEECSTRRLIKSLVFYFNKYGGGRTVSEETLVDRFSSSLRQALLREWTRVFAVDHAADATEAQEILTNASRMVAAQELNRVRYEFGVVCEGKPISPSLDDLHQIVEASVGGDGSGIGRDADQEPLLGPYADLADSLAKLPSAARAQMWRLLLPRPHIARFFLLHEIERLAGRETKRDMEGVGEAIDRLISLGRRHWRGLSPDLIVLAHVVSRGSSALLCRSKASETRVLWLEGITSGSGGRLFGIPLRFSEDFVPAIEGSRWTATVDEAQWSGTPTDGLSVSMGGGVIRVPPMSVFYTDLR